jgi:hypothetical protein
MLAKANSRTLVIPIYYGTISICLGKKGDTYHYKWIAFVKSPDNIDLSFILENVKFILHETFDDTVRGKIKSP